MEGADDPELEMEEGFPEEVMQTLESEGPVEVSRPGGRTQCSRRTAQGEWDRGEVFPKDSGLYLSSLPAGVYSAVEESSLNSGHTG